MEPDDAELLRRYAEAGAEDAFAELVRRYVGLVYQAARRQTGGDAHRAADITQAVFTLLARKAGTLRRHETLAGWLHATTRFTALRAFRTERRRRQRETEAQHMQEIMREEAGGADWERLRPVIDQVLAELNAADRDAVLLRFFAARPLAEIGARLGLTENAARMRVERALDKLRERLARRGIASSVAALTLALTGEGVAGAPAGLAAAVTTRALAGGAASATGVIASAGFLLKLAGVIAGGCVLFAVLAWRPWRGDALTLRPATAATKTAAAASSGDDPKPATRAASADARNPSDAERRLEARKFYEEGMKLERAKRYDEAIVAFTHAIEADPRFYDAYFSRAAALSSRLPMDRRNYAQAVEDYTRCLEVRPRDYSARFNRAGDYRQLGDYAKALADFTAIIDGDTDYSHMVDPSREKNVLYALADRGKLRLEQFGDYAGAIADYDEVLRLDPGNKDFGLNLHYNRGRAYQAQQRYELAEADFAAAYQLDPSYPNLLASWAWQLATAPDEKYRDGKAALQLALAATEKFKSSVAEHLDVLAAAYAENGRFDDAVAAEEKALVRIESWERKRVPDMAARLALFRSRQPFRER